jgi:hypothetical protein
MPKLLNAMLPNLYQALYRDLLETLSRLIELSSQDPWDIAMFKSTLAQLQQLFSTQVLSLNLDDLEPRLEHQVQSFNVEINKQLRLLTVDLLFLQSAKQTTTIAQRLQQVRDRLTTLIRYCTTLLELE